VQATRQRVAAADKPARFDTAWLFEGSSEIRLLHRGQEYRLRVTKQGKLILTK
jgi:hemin uptake protein HemP